jgi:hypothetical protein
MCCSTIPLAVQRRARHQRRSVPRESHLASADEPSPRSIDLFLDDFERELELRARSEAELGPVVHALLYALYQWNMDRRNPDLIDQAFSARALYVSVMEEWTPLLKEWIPIRHTALRLEERSPFMSDAQWERFNRLQMLEAQNLLSTSALDNDHQDVRPLLHDFEAVMRRR